MAITVNKTLNRVDITVSHEGRAGATGTPGQDGEATVTSSTPPEDITKVWIDADTGEASVWNPDSEAWVIFLGSGQPDLTTEFAAKVDLDGSNVTDPDEWRDSIGVQEWVNVKTDFNAVGDGVADDTAEILAALATTKNIYFPAGTYNVSSSLEFTSSGPSNAMGFFGRTFRGDSAGSAIIKQTTNAANGFMFTGSQSGWLTWEDLTVQGSGAQSSTGIGIGTTANLNLFWQVNRCSIMRWQDGFKGPMVQALIQNSNINDCSGVGIWFADSSPSGVGVNRNTVRGCGIGPSGTSGQTPLVAHTGIRFDAGKGLLVDGIDVGGPLMNTIVQANGNTWGEVRNVSSEIFSSAGNTTALFNSSAAGVSVWSIRDCYALAFNTMLASDWPVIQGTNVTLHVSNLALGGAWQNGAIRTPYAASGATLIYPLDVSGNPVKIDRWNSTTSAIQDSYYSNPFGARGTGALTAAATTVGRFLADFRQGGQDDGLLMGIQRAGTTTYAFDNLNQYNADVRNGRLNSLSYAEIPLSSITATANSSFGTDLPANTLDGNNATYWRHNGSAAAGTSWLKYDFATARLVTKLRLWPDQPAVMTITVTGSNDDSTYTEVGRFKTLLAGDGAYLINPTIPYRYYRVNFINTHGAVDWLGVYTAQFWRPIISGEIVGAETKTYANDAAADADAQLPSGSFYMITGARTLYRKP